MSTHRDIDKFIRQKSDEFHVEMDDSHWQAMEAMLDKQSEHKVMGWLYWVLMFFVLCSIGFFFYQGFQNDPPKEKGIAQVSSLTENVSHLAVVEAEVVEIQSSRTTLQKKNSRGFDQLSDNRGTGSLDALPPEIDVKVQHGNMSSWSKGMDDASQPLMQLPADGDLEAEISAVDRTHIASLDLSLAPYRRSLQNLWDIGIGWHVENSWGWSAGAFASLGYRFHRSLSVSFRPGFTLRSDNNAAAESYKQVEYDFGRTDIEGKVDKLQSYAVDVPLSLQLHKQRHILALGGGLQYAFIQKVAITERHLSNLTNFNSQQTPFYENTIHRKSWVQPNESFFPFAELTYSYLLSPSFELGGRSRFYIPDDLGLSNRLNFAAQLVWKIN